MNTSSLSGKLWWRANQGRYPNSQSLDDLEPGFQSRVELFIQALRHSGAQVLIHSTLRNPKRAHLMHYSWKVAYGEILPNDVPAIAGVSIKWDHGDLTASVKAAREMVSLFGMVHNASLNSNHTRGKAIDMSITWRDTLLLTQPAPLLAKIESNPKNGQNIELHRIGATVFGVKKLASDPPHWSHNGK